MQLNVPTIQIKSRRVDVPELERPKMERPKVELPRLDLRKVELSKMEMPKMDLRRPDVEMPDLSGAGKAITDTVGAVGDRIGTLGREVRSIRVTRKPEPNTKGTAGLALLGGLGSGMALMFFFDPEEGKRRRALLRDKLVRIANVLNRTLSGRAKDIQNRTSGVAHTVRSAASSTTEAMSGAAGAVAAETPYAADQLESVDAAAGAGTAGAATGSDWSTAEDSGQAWGESDARAAGATTQEWSQAEMDASRESSGYGSLEQGSEARETTSSKS